MRRSVCALGVSIICLAVLSCAPGADNGAMNDDARSVVCKTITQRATVADVQRPFTQELARECQAALREIEDGKDILSSWHAVEFLKRAQDLEAVIFGMGDVPGRYGEYLIAREIGVTKALETWQISRRYAELRQKQARVSVFE